MIEWRATRWPTATNHTESRSGAEGGQARAARAGSAAPGSAGRFALPRSGGARRRWAEAASAPRPRAPRERERSERGEAEARAEHAGAPAARLEGHLEPVAPARPR